MTAKRLVAGLHDAAPVFWDRAYSKYMRQVVGYPNYWRITDDVAFIDGPPETGQQYTRELFTWKAEIRKDDFNELTDTIDLFNISNNWETWQKTEPDNSITYYYKYVPKPAEETYAHTHNIDNVSLEFDQSGRFIIAFESNAEVYLWWYDPQPQQFTTTKFADGRTPHIVTDTYARTYGSAASERLLFYVNGTTNQIEYRRQLDRYNVAYQLPNAPADVVEIL